MSVMVTPDMDEWELQIQDVGKEDEGKYECQVNTNPLSQLLAKLSVTSMNTRLTLHNSEETIFRIFRRNSRGSGIIYGRKKLPELDVSDP